VSVENRDLQAAIDDMPARFPKDATLPTEPIWLTEDQVLQINQKARRAKPASLIS